MNSALNHFYGRSIDATSLIFSIVIFIFFSAAIFGPALAFASTRNAHHQAENTSITHISLARPTAQPHTAHIITPTTAPAGKQAKAALNTPQ